MHNIFMLNVFLNSSKLILVMQIIHKIHFLKDFIYFFLERGEGREKERKRNINVWLLLTWPLLGTWPATQACALTGNRTGDSLVHSPCSIH